MSEHIKVWLTMYHITGGGTLTPPEGLAERQSKRCNRWDHRKLFRHTLARSTCIRNPMIGTAHHYGVTVADMDKTLPFYRDTLGLDVVSQGHVEAGSEDSEKFEKFVGVDGAVDVKVAFLDAGGCQVELLEYTSPDGEDAHGVSNNDPGASHFCLQVEDIDSVYEELTDDGVEFVYEPITLSKGVRVAYMYDPEGNIVELSDRSGVE